MYYLFLLGKILVLIFSRKVCYLIAKLLALVRFYLSKKDREAIFYNLSEILKGKNKLKKTAKEVFINFSYYLVDFFRYSKLNIEFINKYVKIEGIEHLKKSLSKNKGAIVLSAHFGNYELGAAVLGILGYRFYVVALPHKDARLNRFFDRQRKKVKLEIIPTKIAAKKCLSLLDEGKIIGLLGDRDFTKSGLRIKIFSKYALLPRGPAFLAFKKEVDVIPSFFIREKVFFYRLIFEEPIVYDLKKYKTEEDLIEAYALVLRKYLEKYPQQWYLFEKYWL